MTPDPSKLAVKEPPPPKPKRFYKTATVGEGNGAFRVLLDGKPVRTPLKKTLETKSRPLAEAVAAEWQQQVSEIDAAAMPLTRLLSTQLDVIGSERTRIIAELLRYAGTDLLCYRASHPRELKIRQDARWQPVLDW